MKRKYLVHGCAGTVLVLLSACGGGSGGASDPAADSGIKDKRAIATKVRSAVTLASCPAGGIAVDSGIDSNSNGTLDEGEISSTQYVCNGGSGLTTLVSTMPEPVGTNCGAGGNKVNVGLDANLNSVLDDAEISSSGYICDGIAGSNGFNSLLAIVTEAAGVHCISGGKMITSGLDSNSNGVLDVAEVRTTDYLCNGPGLISWRYVSGSSVQAAANHGYMVDNTAPVTVTLPAVPAVGDIVQVTGVGSGGWKIAQNAGQSIVARNLPSSSWNVRGPTARWQALAASADGSKLVAAEFQGRIYTSQDSGATWTARDTDREWTSVASSADGAKLAATVVGGNIYTSTDYGQSWTPRESSRAWAAIASSADGAKLVAVQGSISGSAGGYIYTSSDSGLTWTQKGEYRGWRGVASSADGTRLVAVDWGSVGVGGQIYISTDSGETWSARGPAAAWMSVASSANGKRLIAASQQNIYMSVDGGLTWGAVGPVRSWHSVASSADGSRLMAVDWGGQVHVSKNSGLNWTFSGPYSTWSATAISADGTVMVAANNGDADAGQLYVSRSRTTPGTDGSLSGLQYDAAELQYVGNDTFVLLSHEGNLVVQ